MKKSLLITSLTVAWLGHFFVDMMLGIWPVFKTFAGLDIAIAGLISGFSAFLGEGLQLLFGSLSDKGHRKFLILAGVLATTSSVCFVYTDNYLILFALYLITCVGSGAFHPSAASLVANLPSENKSAMVGVFTSGGALGMAFSQIIFTYTYFTFEGHVLWLALPAILLMAFAIFKQMETPHAPAMPGEHKHFNLKAIKSFFRHRDLRMLYITQVCGTTMFWGTVFLLPDVLVSRGYEQWIAFGGGHMAFVLGGAFMMIPAGYLADRYSAKHVIIATTIAGMGLFYVFLLFPLLSDYNVLVLLLFAGAALSCINPVGLALATRMVPNHKGLVSAIMMGMVWAVSEVLGQSGGGLLTKCFDDDAPAKALAVLGSLFLVGLITASQLPQKETELELVEYVRE